MTTINPRHVPTQADADRIRKGIAAYDDERKTLLRLLRRYGQFTECDFDRWFRGVRKFKAHGITSDTFILGAGANGFNHWAEMLDLLQHMMLLGEVDATTENGIVVYRLTKQSEVA